MSDAALSRAEVRDEVLLAPEPDISHIVTETEEPVGNIISEKQMRLLVEPLYSNWRPGREFLAASNVGIFSAPHRPPMVPDMFLSMDVHALGLDRDPRAKRNRSYFVWEFGKPPEVVVELVSNREGGELTRKLAEYARMRISYYAVFDPGGHLSETPLQFFVHIGDHFEPMSEATIPPLGLALRVWQGDFEGIHQSWIRWVSLDDGNLIPTGAESAIAAGARALAAEAVIRELEARLRRAEQS